MNGKKLFMLLVVILGIIILLAIIKFGRDEVLRFWNIPLFEHTFIDLRGVLTGMEATRVGYDPLRENPFDPFGRPVPYPRLWFLFSSLGLSGKHTDVIAGILIVAFIFVLPLAFNEFYPKTALWLIAITFSPSLISVVTKANLDLFIFILLALTLWFSRKMPWLSFLFLELSAFLKLYPVFGFGYLLKDEKTKSLRDLAIAFGIFIIYIALTWRDTSWIFGHTPKEAIDNYGVTVVSFRIFELTDSEFLSKLFILPAYLLAYVIFIFVLVLSSRMRNLTANNSQYIDGFRLGTLIFIGTFIQGNTYNYRLMFTLFAIPQLVYWYQNHNELRRPAFYSLILLILSAWGVYWGQIFPLGLGFYFDEIINWILYSYVLYLFLVSCPEWIRLEIFTFVERFEKRRQSYKHNHLA